jgi:hypothetical protein
MGFLPSFAAKELMEASNEVAIFRDHDRYRGLQWNLAMALKTIG